MWINSEAQSNPRFRADLFPTRIERGQIDEEDPAHGNGHEERVDPIRLRNREAHVGVEREQRITRAGERPKEPVTLQCELCIERLASILPAIE
ncbi:hypothetical protein HY230_01520 [Candidatus Acetothermia bacterium]|nr:hypothetical protein [Candidatus Acetothermia bacterium]